VLVATFSADTAWAGRRITHHEGRFALEGFGAISAAQVLEYDSATPLVWSTGGTRAWVRSLAHREGGARGAPVAAPASPARAAGVRGWPSAAPPSQAAPAPVRPPAAPASLPADAVSSRAQECEFARAHYVGGQPSLGPPLDGSLQVTALGIALRDGDAPGPSLSLADVAAVSLHGAQAPATSGIALSAGAGAHGPGSPGGGDRTFIVAHLRPKGYEAFAVDGLTPGAVRETLGPVLAQAGVRLQGSAPVTAAAPVTDEVQRLAELNAAGALTDDEFRARLGPVFTAAAGEAADDPGGASGAPARMTQAAREVALERLNELRLSGVITDAELAAMRGKLLE